MFEHLYEHLFLQRLRGKAAAGA